MAEQIYNKRKTEVAMAINFPSRKFKNVSFKELFDYWWENHAKNRPSKFEYLTPRIKKFFKLKARYITSDLVREFLNGLKAEEDLSASSLNHYRTILNSVFNYAIRNKKYDENPVQAVPTFPEPPGRDRFTTPEEILKFFEKCDEEGDTELKVFVVIAATTGLRKGSILPRKYADIFLDEEIPYIFVGKTKNGDPIKIPLAEMAVEAIKSLPSYGKGEYLFPAKPNVRFKGDFKKPHAWDLGKRFRRICKLAGINNLRIHDLRHFATTVLFMDEIPDAMIAKMTGHRSRELRKYQHLSPQFRKQTVERIARKLTGTSTGTVTVSELLQ
ncbi:MAG TPA: site-specific integrase [Pyrinomonadaceae bacterium]